MEEIYHEGEEGARKAGIEGAFLFLCVPGEPQLTLVRLSGKNSYSRFFRLSGDLV
ncbi:MAG: hypothetical protein LBH51_04055 [Treponema sp.]|jgi:hypothetical protein|nr:hypothetical protein [Treponema sp.]